MPRRLRLKSVMHKKDKWASTCFSIFSLVYKQAYKITMGFNMVVSADGFGDVLCAKTCHISPYSS